MSQLSLSGKRWVLRKSDPTLSQELARHYDLPLPIATIMAGRGIDRETAPLFLKPQLRQQLPDPSLLLDMDKAIARLVLALERQEIIGVYGDYDVDGATSSALLVRYIRALGGKARCYIPDRQKEGYGPNDTAFQQLAREGVNLIVTLDCGISAYDVLEAAHNRGQEIIVVDHHQALPTLPKAFAIVNPNRLDQILDSNLTNLAAVGVAFLLLIGMNRALRQSGFFSLSSPQARQEPNLLPYLDLVALGTICDVMPLRGLNRCLVVQGLKIIAQGGNQGLAKLISLAGLSTHQIEAGHLSFAIGPRVNAGGRVGKASLGSDLFTSDNPTEQAMIAEELGQLNRQRQDIEAICLEQAYSMIEAEPNLFSKVIVLGDESFHPGVVGILASRLKDRYHRPSLVYSLYHEGEKLIAKGSARSIEQIDIGKLIIEAKELGILTGGGGHRMAAGFSLPATKLDEFKSFLAQHLDSQSQEIDFTPIVKIDGILGHLPQSIEFIEALDSLAPFGAGHAEPRFLLSSVRVHYVRLVGQHHLRCQISDEIGQKMTAIGFRTANTPFGEWLRQQDNQQPICLTGRMQRQGQGRSGIEFHFDDGAPLGYEAIAGMKIA